MKQTESSIEEPSVACDINGVPPEKRERWVGTAKQVYAAVEEVKELPNGYSCRLPNDQTMLLLIAEYVSLDRLCCRFATWNIEVTPDDGPLWLHITGPVGAKELTKSTFETTVLLREEVALAAGISITHRKAWSDPKNPSLTLK